MSSISCLQCVIATPIMLAMNYANILFNGFAFNVSQEDQKKRIPIRFEDFYPINEWNPCCSGKKDHKVHLIDTSTNNKYFEEESNIVRTKCMGLFIACFTLTPIALLFNVINRVVKLVLLAHFWPCYDSNYIFKARLNEAVDDLLLIITAPLLWAGMVFSTAYGAIYSPYDGRKLYATFERLTYSGGYQQLTFKEGLLQNRFLADCFQPRPLNSKNDCNSPEMPPKEASIPNSESPDA